MVIKPSTFTQISSQRSLRCQTDSCDLIARFSKRKIDNQTRYLRYSTSNYGPLQLQQSYQRCNSFTNIITSSITRRQFHNYFLTNLSPIVSGHSDRPSPTSTSSSAAAGPRRHNLSDLTSTSSQKLAKNLQFADTHLPSTIGIPHGSIVVRIPLESAKQHFGVSQSRGTRPSNEDTYQAGIIEIPAFAKECPLNHNIDARSLGILESDCGGPQVFGFGVFDGHGGNECSEFLKEKLYDYIEKTADVFELECSVQSGKTNSKKETFLSSPQYVSNQEILVNDNTKDVRESDSLKGSVIENNDLCLQDVTSGEKHDTFSSADSKMEKIIQLEKNLIQKWKDTVGGYFRRFKPQYFSNSLEKPASIESVLMYAFLKADFDFISAQAHKHESSRDENNLPVIKKRKAINDESVTRPERFLGGSTASIALISTPTPVPFWHPSSPSTMLVAHVGDTRIILCNTTTGLAKPCTTNHHPSSPGESNRMRRYATSFVTDSFGEERVSGLANTRAFGDIHSKRIGVTAEPDIYRFELMAAEYSMLVLVSDGVSSTLNDQEIVDIVKEANTPEQGARDVVAFATEVSKNGDNATCLVVRLGGWERRREGGLGSLGTMECREWRRTDASDMRTAERHR